MELDKLNKLIDFCDEPKNSDLIKLSVIITSRAESWPVLAMTLASVQEEAIAATSSIGGKSWECLVIFNGLQNEDSEGEDRFKESHFRQYGNFRYVRTNVPSSSVARGIGVYKAVGKYVYIGDSHIIVGRNCFAVLMDTHHRLESCDIPIGILHSSLGWMSGVHNIDLCDHYTPKLKEKFWGNYSKSKIEEPHRICMKGTSFLMLRNYAMEIGLWNLNFTPYGGNEPYLNLKTWRFGYEVWVDPSAYIWHLAYQRNYSWTNDGFWFNQMLAAYTIGGDRWLENQYNNYVNQLSSKHSGATLDRYLSRLKEIRDEVVTKGKEDMEWINNRSKYTLDELIAKYNWE